MPPFWIVTGVVCLVWITVMAKAFDYLHEKWKVPGVEPDMQ